MQKIHTIGENIRKYRQNAKMSQKQLATALNVSTATISKYESDRAVPSATTIGKLAVIFNTSADVFLPSWQPEDEETFDIEQ